MPAGIFPMAESADDPTLVLGRAARARRHPARRLPRPARGSPARSASDRFEIRVDRDFDGVIAGCAAPRRARRRPGSTRRIRRLYGELFDLGHCHTVEAWRDGRLVGGLYGVRLGAAFFGESMFHRERDASKVALVHLVARLARGRLPLLDTQFVTTHLAQFGAVERAPPRL